MANFSRFPREILFEIIFYLSPLSSELMSSSCAWKSLGEVATAALCAHIDLNKSDGDAEANVKSEQRQGRLLLSIAEYVPYSGVQFESCRLSPEIQSRRSCKDLLQELWECRIWRAKSCNS